MLDTPIIETVQKMVLTCGIGDLQTLKECFDLGRHKRLSQFMQHSIRWKNDANKLSTIELIRNVEMIYGPTAGA